MSKPGLFIALMLLTTAAQGGLSRGEREHPRVKELEAMRAVTRDLGTVLPRAPLTINALLSAPMIFPPLWMIGSFRAND